ncbi:MAG: hypothetical protein [Caudoviricetes sp.]|nr:MAG: hypothetical protein [Caudoviricetes sp.]
MNTDTSNIGVYVLRLENDKWYVGYSADLAHRLDRHTRGGGASGWTRTHKVLEVYAVVRGVGKDYEREATLSLMRQCGWENVRGAGWCCEYLAHPPKALRKG